MNLLWAKGWLADLTPSGIDETMARYYADDVHFEDVALGSKHYSATALRTAFGRFAASDSHHRMEVTNYSGDDEFGAIEWTWHCEHETDVFGIPARGKRTAVRGVSLITLQDGKIVAERDYWNVASLMQQLGALK
jgi:steroid delta-isomerase-like uncharacterized protein